MEDLDKVEPAVQEAQQGEYSVQTSLSYLRVFLSSCEIDQETKSCGN